MTHFLARAIVLLALAAFPASAQDIGGAPDAPVDPAMIEDRVVVTGQRPPEMSIAEYVRNFVKEVADPVSRNYGYARWDGKLCVGIENLQEDAAQFIADRISEVALDVGLDPGQPGCKPNLAIVFTVDGQALANYLVEEEPGFFRPFGGTGGTTQGLAALDDFATSDDPVRWWHITMIVDLAGNIATQLSRVPENFNPGPSRLGTMGINSRITRGTREKFWTGFVIVDVTKLDGITWSQLADYLAMVSLAQVDPGTEADGYDSVLNVFNPSASVGGLTDWDLSYLQALYDLDRNRIARLHRGGLVRIMARDQRRAEEEARN